MGDMLSLLPQYAAGEFDSRHRLVIVAAQRAKQLVQGARTSSPSKFTKETSIALDEVLRHSVQFLVGKEARDAIKESKRVKEGETERLAMMTGEDAKEIKKRTQRLRRRYRQGPRPGGRGVISPRADHRSLSHRPAHRARGDGEHCGV